VVDNAPILYSEKINEMRKKQIFFILLLCTSQILLAQNRTDAPSSAKAMALGGACTALSGQILSVPFNSASAAELNGYIIAGSAGFSFGGMDWKTLDSQPTLRLSNEFYANYIAVGAPITLFGINTAFVFSYQQKNNFNNKYTLEDVFPTTYKESGNMLAYSATLAIKMNVNISLGFSFHYHHGKYDNYIGDFGEGNRYSGASAEAGALYRIVNDIILGASIHLPSTLKNSNNKTNIYKDIPPSGNLGIVYNITNNLLLAADYHYRPWSLSADFKNDTKASQKLKDVSSWHIGAEYNYIDGQAHYPIWLGASYVPGFGLTEANGEQAVYLSFSAGLEYPIGNFSLNTAIRFQQIEYWDTNLNATILKNEILLLMDAVYTF
jgi:hypothetical protein